MVQEATEKTIIGIRGTLKTFNRMKEGVEEVQKDSLITREHLIADIIGSKQ